MSADLRADRIVIRTTGAEAGGGSVGRLPDGRAVFVRGALPGERVLVRLLDERERFAFAEVVEVLEPADGRVTPPCPQVQKGCGGCSLQHASVALQRAMKAQVLADALARIAKLDETPPIRVVDLPTTEYRTTVRAAVDPDGRLGFRHARSHEVVAAAGCLVAHPTIADLLATERFPGAEEVTIRVGARTGELLVVAHQGDATDSAAAPLHEEVAGRRWRISAESFFQGRVDGAEALVAEVRAAVQELAGTPDTLVDLCSGVGLFAGTVEAARVVAVEANHAAIADARHNLAELGDRARLVALPVERWRPSPADVVIADPPRRGLRRVGVERVAATGAGVVVLVSCDSGSFGRDVGLLVAAGYTLERVVLIDMFPHTHHVEVVSAFVRSQLTT